MSELIVEVCKIDQINEHPNADRLEIATVKGWVCIVGKGEFKEGDKCVYIPIDSVLPEDLEAVLFAGSKISLGKQHRVKTIKLRGCISQGLVIPPDKLGFFGNVAVGDNLKDTLGITKYEPPAKPSRMQGPAKPKRDMHPEFKKYTNINHLKNYNRVFAGIDVVVTEKIHGTNFRCGWLPFIPRTLWQKVKALFGFGPKMEFVFGSHNVQLQDGSRKQFYKTNVYNSIVKIHDLKEKLRRHPNKLFYSEIFGAGIQSGYTYGRDDIDVRWVDVFDCLTGKYLNWNEFCQIILPIGSCAPVIYMGEFDAYLVDVWAGGMSILSSAQKLREGCVIKPIEEFNGICGRAILKHLNPEYLLLKDNTEYH